MRVPGSRQILAVWVIFVLSSLAGTPVPGVNEPHYLAKARSFSDADWCHRDFFLTSGNAHFCFYSLTGPIAAVISPDVVAVAGRLVSLLILAWGWCRLAAVCGLKTSAQVTSAAVMLAIAGLGSFSGEWIVGGFESKVLAWGLALGSAAYQIRSDQGASPRETLRAGLLVGLAVSFHPVVGMWFALATVITVGAGWAMGFVKNEIPSRLRSAEMLPGSPAGTEVDHLAASRRGERRPAMEICVYLTGCLATALPGLIPAVSLLRQTNVSPAQHDLANFVQVFWRLKHHLDPTEFRAQAWIHTLILSLVCTVCCLRIRASGIPRRGLQQLTGLLLTAAGIAAAGVAVGWHTVAASQLIGWEWRAGLLKYYPFRLFDGLLPIATAISAMHVVPRVTVPDRVLQVAGGGRALRFVGFLILTTLVAGFAWWHRPDAPGGYTREQFEDWRIVCRWVREHTPHDALFLTPRESFGFKWFAERAEFVTYKDCPQDAAGILQWNDRLWYVSGWMQRSSADGQYDRDDLRELRRGTDVDYFITRIPVAFADQPLFAGRFWRIYRVQD